MNNFEALKQMPLNAFANLVFNAVNTECNTLEKLENVLQKEFPQEGEGALQNLQHSIPN